MEKTPHREKQQIKKLQDMYGEDADASSLLSNLVADAWSLEETEASYNEIWRYKPVDGRTFYSDFLRKPRYPVQQEFHDRMFGYDPLKFRDITFEEGNAAWGKGSGKDDTIGAMLTYGMYLLCCLRNPQQFLGFGEGSPIDIANVSINAQQAQNVFFKHFKGHILNATDPETGKNWFATKNCWKDPDGSVRYMDLREGQDVQRATINFGRGVAAHSLNSETYTGEGLSLLFVVFDEIGAFPITVALGGAGARGLYDALKASMLSRNPKGYGAIFVFSYKYDEDCPMSVLVRRNESNPKIFISTHATWEVRPEITRQSLAGEYLKDPDVAKRTYEFKGSGKGTKRAIRRQEVIEANIDRERICPVLWDKKFSTDDPNNLQFHSLFRGEPNVPYFVHIDGAKGKVYEGGDAVGFALAHPVTMATKVTPSAVDELAEYGINVLEEAGMPKKGVHFDLLLQIIAKQGNEVILSDLRRLVWRLKAEFGFNIQQVSFDGWESASSIQEFQQHGMASKVYSVDRKTEGYDTLKELEYQGLVSRYRHPIYERELQELEFEKGKYDHPTYSARRALTEGVEKGSKDVTDAAAGVSVQCVQASIDMDTIAIGMAGSEEGKPLTAEETKQKQEEWEKHADEVTERKRREFESGNFSNF